MEESFWVMISIIGVILFLAIIFLIVNKYSKKKRPIDYFGIFIMGVIWIVIGVPLQNVALLILGSIFTVFGLLNKGRWDKNKVRWKKLTRKEKTLWVRMIIFVIVILIVLSVVYFGFIRKLF